MKPIPHIRHLTRHARTGLQSPTVCRTVTALLVALACATASAQSAPGPVPAVWVTSLAQPQAPVTGETGQFLPWINNVKPDLRGKVSAADAKVWGQQLRAIADFIAAAPLLSPPRGFYPTQHGFVDWLAFGPYLDAPAKAPLVGGVEMAPWLPEQMTRAADGTMRPKTGEEVGASMRLELNYIYPPAGAVWMHDAVGEFGVLDIQGQFAGFPVVGQAVIITRDGKLPYVPVSQERVLQAFIAHYAGEAKRVDAEAARARQAYDAYNSPAEQAKRRARIDAELAAISDASNRERQRRYLEMWERSDGEKLLKTAQPDIEHDQRYAVLRAVRAAQASLAAMSPAERAQPAWIRRGDVPTEAPLVAPGQGVAVVAIDGRFFDPRQPRTTLRIALLRQLRRVVEDAQDTKDDFKSRAGRISLTAMQQLDWQQFAQRFLR